MIRQKIRNILYLLDPEALAKRKQKKLKRRVMRVQGPNFVWSVDGYDKLSHWGFYVHGCIDAYSRYIIWLQIGISNKKSQIILKYYLDAVNELRGKD
jgi:transposase InsO family protein